MANPENRYPDNVSGRFYVASDCIDCGLCGATAPGIFRESGGLDHHVVHRQPESPADIALAREAIEACPVEAIGENPGDAA